MKKSIWKIAGGVTLITFFSRITGYFRDKVLAYFLGASLFSDAFFVAFRIPNMFRGLLAEGALHASFIPIFSEIKREKKEEILRFLSQVFYVLAFVSGCVVILGVIFSPLIVKLMAKEFELVEGKFNLTVFLNRIMFPYLFFISLAGLMQGILNVYSKFYLSASTPIFLNFSIILLGIALLKIGMKPVYSFSIGVLIGGFLQFYTQYLEVKKIGIKFYLPKSLISPEIKMLFYKILPGVFALGINEVNQIIGTRFAAISGDKSVSYLYYSFRLIHLIYGGVIISLFTLLLPALSEDINDKEKFTKKLKEGMEITNFITIPSIIGLSFLSNQIITILFLGGKFRAEDSQETSFCLIAYSFSLLPYAYSKILTSAFFAKKDTKTPAFSSLISLFSFTVFCFLLTYKYRHVGIAISNSISAFFQFFYLLIFSKKIVPEFNLKETLRDFFQVLVLNIPIFFVLFYLSASSFLRANQKIFYLSLKTVVSIFLLSIFYFAFGILFKNKASLILKNLFLGSGK